MCLLGSLHAAGFQVASAVGSPGQLWVDYGGGLELEQVGGFEDAIQAFPGTKVWGLELHRRGDADGLLLPLLTISTHGGEHEHELVELQVSFGSYAVARSIKTAPLELCALAIYIAGHIQPVYGWGGSNYGLFGWSAPQQSLTEIIRAEPRPVEWLMVFGRDYCERIGLGRLLSAPAWRVG